MFLSFFMVSCLQAASHVNPLDVPLLIVPSLSSNDASVQIPPSSNRYYAGRLKIGVGPLGAIKGWLINPTEQEDPQGKSTKELVQEELERISALGNLSESIADYVCRLVDWIATPNEGNPDDLFCPDIYPENPASGRFATVRNLWKNLTGKPDPDPLLENARTAEERLIVADLYVLRLLLRLDDFKTNNPSSSTRRYLQLIEKALDASPLTATMGIMKRWYSATLNDPTNVNDLSGLRTHIYYPGFSKTCRATIRVVCGVFACVFVAYWIHAVLISKMSPDCTDGWQVSSGTNPTKHGFEKQDNMGDMLRAFDQLVNPGKTQESVCKTTTLALSYIATVVGFGQQCTVKFFKSPPGSPPDIMIPLFCQEFTGTIDRNGVPEPGCSLITGGSAPMANGGVVARQDKRGRTAIFSAPANEMRTSPPTVTTKEPTTKAPPTHAPSTSAQPTDAQTSPLPPTTEAVTPPPSTNQPTTPPTVKPKEKTGTGTEQLSGTGSFSEEMTDTNTEPNSPSVSRSLSNSASMALSVVQRLAGNITNCLAWLKPIHDLDGFRDWPSEIPDGAYGVPSWAAVIIDQGNCPGGEAYYPNVNTSSARFMGYSNGGAGNFTPAANLVSRIKAASPASLYSLIVNIVNATATNITKNLSNLIATMLPIALDECLKTPPVTYVDQQIQNITDVTKQFCSAYQPNNVTCKTWAGSASFDNIINGRNIIPAEKNTYFMRLRNLGGLALFLRTKGFFVPEYVCCYSFGEQYYFYSMMYVTLTNTSSESIFSTGNTPWCAVPKIMPRMDTSNAWQHPLFFLKS